jgi:PTS system mannose-specific IIC component
MMTGLVAGVVFGDVANAMMITAAIQLIYMGVFAPGGQMPSEPAVAAAIAVPVALLSNMKPEAAIAIAVPVGLLGSYLYQARFFVNTFFIERTVDKYAKAANFKMLSFSIIGIPIIVGMLLYVPFMFITLYYGAPVIADFVAANSATLLFHVLTVIGGGLVSIGIAVTVYVIGKKNYIVFFLLAYFLATTVNGIIGGINKVSGVAELKPDTSAVTVPGVTMITYAIIGGIVAFLYVILRKESAEEKSAAVKVADASDNAAAAGDDDDDY